MRLCDASADVLEGGCGEDPDAHVELGFVEGHVAGVEAGRAACAHAEVGAVRKARDESCGEHRPVVEGEGREEVSREDQACQEVEHARERDAAGGDHHDGDARTHAEREGEKVGHTYECICDGVDDETGMYLLRTKADCPEIDGNVLTPADTPLETGAFYKVTITDSDTYDLYGYAEERLED